MSNSTVVDSPVIASLSTLPIEIKAQIVRLAKLQDDSFKSWARSYRCDIVGDVAHESLRENNEWKGKSLLSLNLVDKEFSSLAAAEIFKKWKISEPNQFFRQFILLHHFKHIQTLKLDFESDLEEIEYAFFILPLLPSLKKLSVHAGCCANFLGNNLLHSLLEPVCAKIRNLKIMDRSLSNIAEFIRLFPCLEKLQIHWALRGEANIYSEKGALASLGNAILGLKGLRKLTFRFMDIEGFHQEWSTLDWSKSSLLSLTILVMKYSAPAVQLATLFSHSLETLFIKAWQDPIATGYPLQHHFPALQQLSLVTYQEVLPVVLLAFSVPSIRQLNLELLDSETDFQMKLLPFIRPFIDSYPNLHTLKLQRLFMDSLQSEFASSSYTHPNHNLQILFPEYRDVTDLLDHWSLRVGPLPPPLRAEISSALVKSYSKILDFEKILFEEVAKEGDNEALYRTGKKLHWIRAVMEERKD